jgi:hypothetical protein
MKGRKYKLIVDFNAQYIENTHTGCSVMLSEEESTALTNIVGVIKVQALTTGVRARLVDAVMQHFFLS